MILALLQARVSSSRLPNKVLADLHGKPMILRQIERVRRAQKIDKLILVTSTDASDTPLYECVKSTGTEVFRGQLNDVLDRFVQAALPHNPEYILRLTGDCPLIDPEVIDATISTVIAERGDYGSNTLPPTYPDGLDCELMKFSILKHVWQHVHDPITREHVTYHIHQNPQLYKLIGHKNTTDLSALRWTVDEPADLEFVRRVYKALYSQNSCFLMQDILSLLVKQPELMKINQDISRNEGLLKSLAQLNA